MKRRSKKGRRALPAFYDEYHAAWVSSPTVRRALNEARIEALPLEDGTLINGKLDRIEFLGDGAASARADALEPVRVIDYKTGKPKSRNEIEGNTKSPTATTSASSCSINYFSTRKASAT